MFLMINSNLVSNKVFLNEKMPPPLVLHGLSLVNERSVIKSGREEMKLNSMETLLSTSIVDIGFIFMQVIEDNSSFDPDR